MRRGTFNLNPMPLVGHKLKADINNTARLREMRLRGESTIANLVHYLILHDVGATLLNIFSLTRACLVNFSELGNKNIVSHGKLADGNVFNLKFKFMTKWKPSIRKHSRENESNF
jgi:hypothetical protein